MSDPITKEQFVERFVTRMLSYAEKFDDGEPVEPYARELAETYWESPEQRADGPEDCADADVSYWGDE